MKLPAFTRAWWFPLAAGGGVAAIGLTVVAIRRRGISRAALPPAGAPPAPGPVVQRVNTGGATWLADRYAALAAHGITGAQAHAIMALWGFETGGGHGEWNYNVGNYTAPKGSTTYFAVPSSCAGCGPGCPCWWIAYDTLDAGVADWIARFSKSWPTAWSQLQNSPTTTDWVSSASSYYGGNTPAKVASYISGYNTWYGKLSSPSA